MARLVLLSLLISLGLVSAFNPLKDELTYDLAQRMLTKMASVSYIPQDVKDEMTSLASPENEDELKTLVDLANKYKSGKIDPPKSRTAAMAFFQANAPATYERVQRLFNNFLAKYNTLSTKAKNYYDQLEAASYKNTNKDISKQAVNNIKLAISQSDKWQNLDDNVKQEFRDRWPEICSFIDSSYYQSIVGYLKRIPANQLSSAINSMMQMMQRQFGQMANERGAQSSDSDAETEVADN